MKKTIITMMSIAILAGCSKNSNDEFTDNPISPQNSVIGAYSGEFTRTGVADTGILMIDINQLRYDGRSQQPDFPGICGGYYEVKGSSIHFEDTCYTGNPAVMLEGAYQFEKKGDSLRFWRTVNGVTDLYRLKHLYR
jgi:hypothetical protein